MSPTVRARFTLRRRVVLRALIFAPFFLAACKEKAPPPRPKPVVAVEDVKQGIIPFIITATGLVEPNRSVAVQAQVSGMITRVAFAEGDDVRQGQVLFEIDGRPFRAALEQARGQVARDNALLARARDNLARYEKLAKDGYATREQLDQFAGEAQALEATVSSGQATIARAQFELGNTVVRAPMSGKTGALALQQGNIVRALTEPPLVVINQVKPVLVRFTVPERDFSEIRARSTGRALAVRVAPNAAAQDSARRPIEGVLTFVDNAIDQSSGAIALKARVANDDAVLWPGQFVTVALELYVDSSAVAIPAQSVLSSQNGTFVYIVDGEGKAKRTVVKAGRTMGPNVVIDTGLVGGERVITDGQTRIGDGMAVEVKGSEGRRPRNTAKAAVRVDQPGGNPK